MLKGRSISEHHCRGADWYGNDVPFNICWFACLVAYLIVGLQSN
jgi:hypothetical protein